MFAAMSISQVLNDQPSRPSCSSYGRSQRNEKQTAGVIVAARAGAGAATVAVTKITTTVPADDSKASGRIQVQR